MNKLIKRSIARWLSLALFVVSHTAVASSYASPGVADKTSHAHNDKHSTTTVTKKAPSFLFVIDAKQGDITKDKNGQFHLELKHADMNHVIQFSDRPNRIVKYITGAKLQSLWPEGRDSFKKDPPNAVLSGTGIKTQIVILNGIHATKDTISLPISVSTDEARVISPLEPQKNLSNITITIDLEQR